MKVLLTGGTGFIGSRLRPALAAAGHQVRIVSRGPGADFDWGPESIRRGVRETEAIVHLAGEGIADRRWTEARKRALVESRVHTTRLLAEAAAERKPRCFLSASAVGYYGPSETVGLTEDAPPGDDFLARICVAWESSASPARDAGVRVVTTRFGVVLHPEGGALAKMLPPFRMFVGGPVGSGEQWVSWIHLSDLVALVLFLLAKEDASGPFNAVAPHPVRMRDFARAIGHALHRPSLVPVPAFVPRLLLGEGADVLLTGQHVVPRRATEAGFRFSFPEIEPALREMLARR
jgi:uncharacterized protein (TIGR01777 family)